MTPPSGWEIADPNHLSKSVQIAFVKKNKSGFCPSMNLAIEKTDISLSEYLKVIKNIHESDHTQRWRQLGKIQTSAGVGELTEIDTVNEWGDVRMLQMVLMHQGYAYIVTVAALKKEFSKYYSDFQNTLKTVQITPDLLKAVPEIAKQEQMQLEQQTLFQGWELTCASDPMDRFQDSHFQKTYWLPFQNRVIKEYEQMGAHWQILFIKTTQENLLRSIR